MNILILNGTPRRRGNSRTALEMIKGYLDADHDVEFLDVCSLKLSGCKACEACRRNGGHCICPDDSDAAIQKVVKADAIVFGTPVYWWGMSSQLKMLVDKFYSQSPQFKTMHKNIGLVISGASGLDNPQYRLIREQFECITEFLHWDLRFVKAFSALAQAEILEQDGTEAKLKEAAEALLK